MSDLFGALISSLLGLVREWVEFFGSLPFLSAVGGRQIAEINGRRFRVVKQASYMCE
jgi:hypothetical protein